MPDTITSVDVFNTERWVSNIYALVMPCKISIAYIQVHPSSRVIMPKAQLHASVCLYAIQKRQDRIY